MKALLWLLVTVTCTGLSQSAADAVPPASTLQTSPPQKPLPLPPAQDATQSPAPIVRPTPVVRPKPATLKQTPAPASQTAPGGTGGTEAPPHKPAEPKAATVANGVAGTRGTNTHPATIAANKPASTTATRTGPLGTAAVAFNRTTIVLDPSHGGVDGGSRISDTLQEKDVDLAFAFKLRSLLIARGFNVVLTREDNAATPPDSGTPLTLDDRAGIANHLHPVACLLLHSTGAGKGVHLYSSELAPLALQPPVVPWLTAQAPWIDASRALQKQLGTALTRAEVPLVMSRASIRPLDSLTCPALVLELAPQGSDKDSVNDGSYQQRIANALAAALIFWQNQAQPPNRQLATPAATPNPGSSLGLGAPSTTTGGQP